MSAELCTIVADGPLRMAGGSPDLLAWSLYPPIALPLALFGGLYALGWARLRAHVRPALLPAWRGWCYSAALLTAWVALLSPIGTLADYFLFAHMVEHLLLIMIVPPLILLGAPALVLLWAFPYRVRRGLGQALAKNALLRAILGALVQPAAATGIYLGTIAVWHLPLLYDLAQGTSLVHEAEHLCFVGAGLLYWWPIVHPAGGRAQLGYGRSLLHVAPGHVEFLILGIVLTFAPGPIYGYYASPITVWHLSPLEDQKLAGLIMWVAGGIIWTIEAGVVFIAWFNQEERQEARERAALVEAIRG